MKFSKFTLIELLIVISVFSILLSLLQPSLLRVLKKSEELHCKQNLKNIGIGAQLWSEDNEDWSITAWWHFSKDKNPSIFKYIDDEDREIKKCPSKDYERGYATNYYITSYSESSNNWLWSVQHGKTKLYDISSPESKVYLMDHRYFLVAGWSYDPFKEPRYDTRWHGEPIGLYGKSNVLWVDGHVSMNPDDFDRPDYWRHYFKPN